MGVRAALRELERDRFWRFVAERQRVWVERVVRRAGRPWTDDPVLASRRFTNVYRHLDPGTQYALREILAREAPFPDRLFNLLVYRLVGRSATHAALGFQLVDDFEPAAFEAGLRARRRDGEPVFTGAYTVSSYHWLGGPDKIANVARLFGTVRDRIEDVAAAVRAAGDLEEAFRALAELPGFGEFLAYQVLVDLLSPVPYRDRSRPLRLSPDAWAKAGPGATEGLAVLTEPGTEVADLDVMRWLHRHHAAEFRRLGIDFAWLRDETGTPIELSLPDIQNCCCEFYKYRTVQRGTAGSRRRFTPADARSAGELRQLYGAADVSVASEDYAATSPGSEVG